MASVSATELSASHGPLGSANQAKPPERRGLLSLVLRLAGVPEQSYEIPQELNPVSADPDLRELASVVAVLGAITTLVTALVLAPLYGPFTLVGELVAGALLLASFILVRHSAVARDRPDKGYFAQIRPGYELRREGPLYVLYVLGSGGHTTEMMRMLQRGPLSHPQMHRRWVVTSGDRHSIGMAAAYERQHGALSSPLPTGTGTFDVCRMERARHVHQPFATAWVTSGLAAYSALRALLLPPRGRPDCRTPTVLVMNGPGSCFVLALVAHLLKIFLVAPHGSLTVVYVESFARVTRLSLTGKLFKLTGIADVFLVQHPELAKGRDIIDAGMLVSSEPDPAVVAELDKRLEAGMPVEPNATWAVF